MLQRPFVLLAVLLLATLVCPISLPLAPLLGYPGLLVIGCGLLGKALNGELERPGQKAFIWMTYLGLVLILHGVVLCSDTALAGAPPGAGQKRIGQGLAYAGAGLAGIGAIVAFLLDPGRRREVVDGR